MNIPKIVSVTILSGTIILSGFSVHAASSNYKGKVGVLIDYESTSIKKASSNASAFNTVKSIQRGKLVSWVERDTENMTRQVTYSTTGKKVMSFYENGKTSRAKMNLNISTSPTTLQSVDTSGNWTPN